jgi:hypothetical protein
MYQRTLDKSSKKFSCPNCTKRTFVKYVEIETGNYLADNFGRCDRESKCGYQAHPPTAKKAYLIDFISLKSINRQSIKRSWFKRLNSRYTKEPNTRARR